MIPKLTPADLVALLVILGILIMNYRGGVFMLPQSGLIILGYYFGHKAASSSQ